VLFDQIQQPRVLFADIYGMKHHCGLRIILLPETHGALERHAPSRSRIERDAYGFVFIIVAATALVVVGAKVIIIAALAVVVILRDRDNLLARWQWDRHLWRWLWSSE
jgi:hypothetical protein